MASHQLKQHFLWRDALSHSPAIDSADSPAVDLADSPAADLSGSPDVDRRPYPAPGEDIGSYSCLGLSSFSLSPSLVRND